MFYHESNKMFQVNSAISIQAEHWRRGSNLQIFLFLLFLSFGKMK